MPASSLPAWYTARSTEQASLNSLSSLITVRLNTESIVIFDKSIQPSLVIQGCLPDDVILSSLCLHNIYLSNAALQLRAERARFLTASNRKSVNAKEPSASSACYVAQSNSFNSSTVNLACLRIWERVERLIGRWAGTMSLNVSVGVVFCSRIWLPRCRTTTHPARRRARMVIQAGD